MYRKYLAFNGRSLVSSKTELEGPQGSQKASGQMLEVLLSPRASSHLSYRIYEKAKHGVLLLFWFRDQVLGYSYISLQLAMLLPRLSRCWSYRCAPPY